MIRWVRHGQSTWNARGRLQGHTAHPPLTDLGRRQAVAAASALAGLHVVRVLCSPAVRARQTAEIIGDRLGLAVEIEPLLVEQGLDEPDPVVADRVARLLRRSRPDGDAVAVTHGDTIRVALGLLGVPDVAVPGNGTISWVDRENNRARLLEPEYRSAGGCQFVGPSRSRPNP